MTARTVFVGGTGRSGTTVLARMLAAPEQLTLVPLELRYHVDRGGLLDLANGESTVEGFRKRILGVWYERQTPMGPRGIREHVTRDELAAVVDRAVAAADDDPRDRARALWDATVTAMFGPGRIVEMTPPTMTRADDLAKVLGDDAVFIDVVRDGRDVAHSLARMKWGPQDAVTGLYWWAHRMRLADNARRRCPVPPLVVRFEELADADAHPGWAARLAEHVGGVSADELLSGFAEFRTGSANIGAWRRRESPEHQRRIDALYARLAGELLAEGVENLPASAVAAADG